MTAHRFSRLHRRALVAAVAGLALTAGCGASEDAEGSAATSVAPTSETPEASGTPVASETPEAESTPIDGTWSTPRLEPGDFRRVLTEQGVGAHADAFLAGMGASTDLTLEIGGGYWTLSGSVDGGAPAGVDRGTYELQGERVTVLPYSGGENVFRWSVDEDDLALALVSTTEPPYEGVPAETYQRGLYTTSDFTRETP